jgi:hypothetical protein
MEHPIAPGHHPLMLRMTSSWGGASFSKYPSSYQASSEKKQVFPKSSKLFWDITLRMSDIEIVFTDWS